MDAARLLGGEFGGGGKAELGGELAGGPDFEELAADGVVEEGVGDEFGVARGELFDLVLGVVEIGLDLSPGGVG